DPGDLGQGAAPGGHQRADQDVEAQSDDRADDHRHGQSVTHRRTPSSGRNGDACAGAAPGVRGRTRRTEDSSRTRKRSGVSMVDSLRSHQKPSANSPHTQARTTWPTAVPYGSTKSRLKMDRPSTNATDTATTI